MRVRRPISHVVTNPQNVVPAIIADLQSSLRGDPALRLGATTARSSATFSGTTEGIQTFVRPAAPNSVETLSGPVTTNQRRALNRMRGLGMTP